MRFWVCRACSVLAASFLFLSTPAAFATSSPVYLIDPFLAPSPATLSNLSLASYVGDTGTIAAQGLIADGVSAAILIFPTSSNASVTVTVTGALAAAYSDNFLTTAPAAGTSSLTIASANFLNTGGQTYAVALIQSPLPTGANFATPAAITIAQGGTPQANLSLPILPPPVILVHGLWGDSTSLAHTEATLISTAPWNNHPELVVPIEYPNDVAFDASEPASTLGTSITSVLAVLDGERIVGGRVDIVAHSMGGLVSRYFSSLPAYRSVRDRNQGRYREIVTIDTPETGSGLATLLLAQANTGYVNLDQPVVNYPQILWTHACIPNNITVAQCFDNLGMPLAPPNEPINSGAVGSLVPGSTSLQNLASISPNIANATWRAVTATAPSKSLLRDTLQNFIDATYTHTKNAPKINTALASSANDVIVTVTSQKSAAGASQVYALKNLQHTTAPSQASALFPSDSNASVVTSSAVDALVVCWLTTDGNTKCPSKKATVAAAMAETQTAGQPASVSAPRSVAWLNVQNPATLTLATPTELAIDIASPGLTGVTLYQRDELRHHAASQPLTITRISGHTAYVQITPMLLGSVTFTLVATFQNGEISSQTFTTPVTAPAGGPSAFAADANFRTIRLGLEPGTRQVKLHPRALYPGLTHPVALDGRVSFRLLDGGPSAPIRLGTDGALEALAPGTATVEARFGDAVDQIQIIVAPIEH